MTPNEKDLEDFWSEKSQQSIIDEQFSDRIISDIELLHLHQRIDAVEKQIKTQSKAFRIVRKVLHLLLK